MRIALGRRAMRRPARVRDAGAPGNALRARLRSELTDAPRGAQAFQRPALNDRDAGGVVAAVFQSPQAFDEQGDDVAARRGADDAAHARFSSWAASSPGP